ncbi:SDR family oxidoreductase [Salinicola sp. MIT1003]|uniref:SDR family NAD(P)-dependent oxidoreductase n=1 Tax=Salinicola sp. MIT1003 TaxID=1882734 RepID=UPI0008DDD551|nr:SDR family oxidoreductase [Salinicola sp. MIT1003]OHZ00431.1 oxidoreductase [Salinicola sp. MIT1003]
MTPSLPLIERFSLAGKRILYTGAAGGLGHETTLEMLAMGAEVIAIDNAPDKAAKLHAAVPDAHRKRLKLLEIDLADHANLSRRLQELVQDRALDIVINNAAIYPSKPFEDYSLEEMRTVHAVNVESALVCTQAALPGMRTQGWGRIINVSSITLSGGWEHLSPYVQSKGALVGLTRAWAREFGKWGITCNAISPGAFPTDAEKIHPDPEQYNRFVLDHQAIKRRGNATDIAAAIVFLASDASAFVTGQTLPVDGGWVMN